MSRRPFSSWPRTLLEVLRRVLVWSGLMERMLFRVELELWSRDVWEWSADSDECGWPCAGPKGVQ